MSEDLFTTHVYKIMYDTTSEPIDLIPFGDIHWGSRSCAKENFRALCKWAKEKISKGRKIFFLGTGDYLDLASYSERRILGDPKIHSTTKETIDDLYKRQADDFCEEIEFMRGRIIGMVEGNHYGKLESGVTTTQIICQRFGCRYLGGSSFIKLQFAHTGKDRTRNAIKIWVHHGSTATKRIGGSVLTVENMRLNAIADIYLCAHDHRKWVATASILDLSTTGHTPKLHHKKILLGRTGSFQKGYEENEHSYVASKQLNPSDLGVIKITMIPSVMTRTYTNELGEQKKEQLTYIDLHGSI